MAQERKYDRQKNVLMSPEMEDRVLLLADDQATSDSAIMRQAQQLGLEILDPGGSISRYRDPERAALAERIRASRARKATGRAA